MSTLNVPIRASQTLQPAFGPDQDRAAAEALAIKGYRTGKLTAGEIARTVGRETSIAAQAWLGDHDIELTYSPEGLWGARMVLFSAVGIAVLSIAFSAGCISHYNGPTTDGGHYVGDCLFGKWHGQGTSTSRDGQKYVGEFRNGRAHGQGTFYWQDGKKYVGDWRNGKQHGHGTQTARDNSRYEGDWQYGVPNGLGTETYADGSSYVGEFQNGRPHGQGSSRLTDGLKYNGGWQNGVANGRGTFNWSDGRLYVGDVQDGIQHGQGTMSWPDGSSYSGGWQNGKRDGEGTCVWPNGQRYIGDWEEGKRHGLGKMVGTKGDTLLFSPEERTPLEGLWTHDRFEKPPERLPSVAVIDFQSDASLNPELGLGFADVCRTAIRRSQLYILVDRRDMIALLGEEDFAAAVKCDDTQCVVDYGKKLRAQKMIFGQVTRVGGSLILAVKMTDVGTARIEAIQTPQSTGGPDSLLEHVQQATCELIRQALIAKP